MENNDSNYKEKTIKDLSILFWAFIFFIAINCAAFLYFRNQPQEDFKRLQYNASNKEIYRIVDQIKKDDKKKIVFLGGSVLWGSTTKNPDDTIPAFFKKEVGDANVYNLALNAARPLDIFIINYLLKDEVNLFVVDMNYHFFQNEFNDDLSKDPSKFIRIKSLLEDNYGALEKISPALLSCLDAHGVGKNFGPNPELMAQKIFNYLPVVYFKDEINLLLFKKHPTLIVQGLFNFVPEFVKKPQAETFFNIFKSQDELIGGGKPEAMERQMYDDRLMDPKHINLCISQEYARFLDDNKVPASVYLLPQNPDILGLYADSEAYKKNNQMIIDAFGGRVIDLHDVLAGESFADTYHLNREGNEAFAKLLNKRIKDSNPSYVIQ